MPITLNPSGIPLGPAPNAYDLCTSAFVQQSLAAGGLTLSPAQLRVVPSLITAASKEIVRFCGRLFVPKTFDEIVTPEGARQDRGEPASAKLQAFPILDLSRVETGRTTALSIRNTDAITNQVATVQFAVTGDVEYLDLAYTGIVLKQIASGVTTSTTLTFAACPTVRSLSDAINAVGRGWSSTIPSAGTAPDLGLFPSTDLVGVREPKGAFSPGAGLDLFTRPASDYDIDRASGIMRVYCGGLGASWGGWADPFGDSWDGLGDYGGGTLGWNQYRVRYTAGFSTVPHDVRRVCVELVKYSLERLATDLTLKSENAKDYSYAVRDSWPMLTDEAAGVLMLYRDWKV